ncbi:hypothetical protein BDK51DRAFT_41284 [Blyttiomyces helicus]|uniref:Uncharacterized protein n=1 Tax=Blyttiomyces helicus TaxID=388810 RepID=A0A4P9WQV8_9FUNG|nr:hypothetical protein BDK51DRAFT_41284 [Blyttiomyces helicus]|eukprot:RKO94218.1 hypothetical protein BDK51DRAFT_41284 [Blyttiomyces helicus]
MSKIRKVHHVAAYLAGSVTQLDTESVGGGTRAMRLEAREEAGGGVAGGSEKGKTSEAHLVRVKVTYAISKGISWNEKRRDSCPESGIREPIELPVADVVVIEPRVVVNDEDTVERIGEEMYGDMLIGGVRVKGNMGQAGCRLRSPELDSRTGSVHSSLMLSSGSSAVSMSLLRTSTGRQMALVVASGHSTLVLSGFRCGALRLVSIDDFK